MKKITYFNAFCIKDTLNNVIWNSSDYPYIITEDHFIVNKKYICGKHTNNDFIRVYDLELYTDVLIQNFNLYFVDLKKYRKIKLDKINEHKI